MLAEAGYICNRCLVQVKSLFPLKFVITSHYFFLRFIYLFMAALGLRCCTWPSLVEASRGYPLVAIHGLLIVMAFLASTGSRMRGLSNCNSWAIERQLSNCGLQAQSSRGMWDLPGSGLEFVSPALAGRFLSPAPPGKPPTYSFFFFF